MHSLYALLLTLLFSSGVHAYPKGAGEAACIDSTMAPSHYGSGAQQGLSPYSVETEDSVYTDGVSITVILKGSQGFKGFLVMAFNEDGDASAPIGTFKALHDDDHDLVSELCDNGLTHTSNFSSLSPNRDTIKLKWTAPPTNSEGDKIRFYATFVYNYTTYWVKVPSAKSLEYERKMIDDVGCGDTSGCYHNCQGDACDDYILKWKKDKANTKVSFELQGFVEKEDSYIALGFSLYPEMRDLTIIACITDDGTPLVADLYAESKATPSKLDSPGSVISQSSVDVTFAKSGTRYITCRFEYDNDEAVVLDDKRWKNFRSGRVFASIARGEFKDGSVQKHNNHPVISPAVDFFSDKYENHGIVLVAAANRVQPTFIILTTLSSATMLLVQHWL